MNLKSEFIYFRRPRTMPPDGLPFYARTAGYYMVDKSYIGGGGACKPFVQFYWGVAGEGLFFLNGKSFCLKPGNVCFYMPANRQYIRPDSERWDFRWMTFAGPLAEAIIKSFNDALNPPLNLSFFMTGLTDAHLASLRIDGKQFLRITGMRGMAGGARKGAIGLQGVAPTIHRMTAAEDKAGYDVFARGLIFMAVDT